MTPTAFRLFATDVEDTVLGDAATAGLFKAAWEALEPGRRPLLAYNTARSVSDIQTLVREGRLHEPQFYIGAMGTEIVDPANAGLAEDFRTSIAPTWNAAAVREVVDAIPGARLQPEQFLNALKLSWYWQCASAADLAQLRIRLQSAAVDAAVTYSSNAFLDITPRSAGKGNAQRWLCQRIGVPLENVLVAGASANNGSVFALPGVRGILPANAARDLFTAARACRPLVTLETGVNGVLAGLRQLGICPPETDGVPRQDVVAAAP